MNEIVVNQVERRLKKLRKVVIDSQVTTGWIYYMRQALSLTLDNLSKLSKLSLASIQQMEKRETEGRITIDTLKKLAHSMECEFIYAFVPQKEIKTILFEQAHKKAKKIIQNADTHMMLEDQKVTENINSRIKRLANELIERGDIW